MRADSNNLNVLRAVAVLAVFFSHCIQYLTGYDLPLGHAGVVLFFLHTSLVLMMSLERQGEEHRWRRFMMRRVFRIYPLSICAVLLYATFNIHWIVGSRAVYFPHLSPGLLLANLSLSQNLLGFDSLPGVLWSLPLELQMYLLLPFLFLVVRQQRSTLELLSIWIVLLVTSVTLALVLPTPATTLFLYGPCFGAGCISYTLVRRRSLPGFAFPMLLAVVLAGLVLSRNFMPAKWMLCLILGMLLPSFHELPNGAISRCAAIVAKYSFGIYLFHSAFLTAFLPHFGWAGTLPALLATLLASAIAFTLIEEPCIALGRSLTSNADIDIVTAAVQAFAPIAQLPSRARAFLAPSSAPNAPSAP